MKMFDWIHAQDAGPKLFLNDFTVVNDHSRTTVLVYNDISVPGSSSETGLMFKFHSRRCSHPNWNPSFNKRKTPMALGCRIYSELDRSDSKVIIKSNWLKFLPLLFFQALRYTSIFFAKVESKLLILLLLLCTE